MRSKSGFCYLAALAVMAILIGAPAVYAITDYNVSVYVNISSVGAIIVVPNSVTWNGVIPGSDGQIYNLTIKNTGSLNVSQIYMNASTVKNELVNPLASTNPASYSAAGLIMVKNATDTAYNHAGRIEWNISSILLGEALALNGATTNFAHGWYRNASGNEFLWALENGTAGYCNATNAKFKIKTAPENYTNMNRDLTVTTEVCTLLAADTESWGVFTCANGPLAGQCIAAPSTCDKILIYKYNYAGDYPACTNRAYLRGGDIVPGSEAEFNLKASIPKGMPAGNTTVGTLTIIASY